jgi:hypothetical protein
MLCPSTALTSLNAWPLSLRFPFCVDAFLWICSLRWRCLAAWRAAPPRRRPPSLAQLPRRCLAPALRPSPRSPGRPMTRCAVSQRVFIIRGVRDACQLWHLKTGELVACIKGWRMCMTCTEYYLSCAGGSCRVGCACLAQPGAACAEGRWRGNWRWGQGGGEPDLACGPAACVPRRRRPRMRVPALHRCLQASSDLMHLIKYCSWWVPIKGNMLVQKPFPGPQINNIC